MWRTSFLSPFDFLLLVLFLFEGGGEGWEGESGWGGMR